MVKQFIHVRRILTSNRGETIMESIVSLLIMMLLLVTVSTMIRFSFSLTSNAVNEASSQQIKANELISAPVYNDTDSLTLSGDGIDVTISVKKTSDDEIFTVFAPAHPF